MSPFGPTNPTPNSLAWAKSCPANRCWSTSSSHAVGADLVIPVVSREASFPDLSEVMEILDCAAGVGSPPNQTFATSPARYVSLGGKLVGQEQVADARPSHGPILVLPRAWLERQH